MHAITQALSEMLPAFSPRAPVRVSLDAAAGLYAATDVCAREDSPPFHNSAMDGYALRAADARGATTDGPVTLPVQGESHAGGALPPSLPAGHAMRIFTGAPVPAGADAVVMQEDTTRDADGVHIHRAPAEGANVRYQGEDLAASSVMLSQGSLLGPGEVGLLASQRYATVTVRRRPTVAILSTGDELRDVDAPAEPGTIVDSNAHALAAQVREAGGEPWMLARAPDALDVLAARIDEGLRADVLLTVGGVSVGEHDLARTAFEQCGVALDLWKVAIKPGKPLAFGRAGAVPVVGLPGNPVSAMVTFEILVRPGIRRMLGDPAPHPAPEVVELATDYRHKPGRVEFVRATLSHARGSSPVAHLHTRQGSGALPSMVGADALVIVPSERETLERGEHVEAIPLRGRRGMSRSPL